jgi:hypothetical protein
VKRLVASVRRKVPLVTVKSYVPRVLQPAQHSVRVASLDWTGRG